MPRATSRPSDWKTMKVGGHYFMTYSAWCERQKVAIANSNT